jgi:hypothetical protein
MKLTKTTSLVLAAALLVAFRGMSASAAVYNWNFNEGSGQTAADSTGGTAAAKEFGSTTWGTQGTRGVNTVDGVAGFNARVGGGAFNTSDGNSFSASVWVKFNDMPQREGAERFLFGKSNFNSYTGWAITARTTGANNDQIRLYYYLGGIDHWQVVTLSVADSDLSNWHHIGLQYDADNQKLLSFHNGVLHVTGSDSGSNHAGSTTSLHINGVGTRIHSSVTIDHARFETGLSDMAAAYNNGVNPEPIPECAALGLLAAGGLMMLRRRSA